MKMAVSDDPFARQAITTFQVLERFEAQRGRWLRLLNAICIPGARIRFAHMRHINHPLVGDPLYGKRNAGHADPRARSPVPSFLERSLCASGDGETVACTDELPWDLAAALDELEDRSMGRTEAGSVSFRSSTCMFK